MCLKPKRRYKRLVSTSKSSPKSKQAPEPEARTPSAAAPGIADVLASVHTKANVLSEALPFMQRYDRQTVVVKYGGHAMGDPALAADFARDTSCEVIEKPFEFSKLRATVDRIWDRKIKYFESAIRDAHAQGLVVAPDSEAKARALFACYHGTLAQARIQNDVELLHDFKEVARDVLGVKHEHAASS